MSARPGGSSSRPLGIFDRSGKPSGTPAPGPNGLRTFGGVAHRLERVRELGGVLYVNDSKATNVASAVAGIRALDGRVRLIAGGRAKQGNFNDYPLVRIGQAPEIETHIVTSGDALGGIGEPGTPPIAPAARNATYALTGTPPRKLPIGKGP